MRIAFVGNFTQSHCTENHLAFTFEGLGHSVTRMQENELVFGTLPKKVEGHDLFFWVRTWENYVTLRDLEEIRELGVPSINYHLDLFVGLTRGNDEALDNDPRWRTDYIFTPDGSEHAAEVFKAKGINHYYMKPGVFENECYMAIPRPNDSMPPPGHEKHDVIFVGGGEATDQGPQYGHKEWPYRGQLIKFLRDTYGNRFGKFGWPQETIRDAALNQLYADSKVVVGDSLCLNFDHPYYWSDRVYETMGRGGFIIHPYIVGLEEEFTDGENIVFYEYGNFTQLKEKIDYYLEHDEEREKIRLAGHEFVKNHATYTDRLKQMLSIVTSQARPTDSSIPFEIHNGKAFKLPLAINFGSGNDPLPDHINVDMLKRDDVDVVHNLMNFPYPFADNSAIHIKAIDLIEHLDHYTDDKKPTIMAFVEECHRILQPGGELYIQTPSWDSELFKIDVTHVRGFHIKSFDFFDDETWYGQIRGFYGGPKFKVRAEELENKNLRFWMVKQ